jgi:hypothetical protein
MKLKQRLTLLILLIFLTTLCQSAVPRLISYQGKLSTKSDSKPLEGVQTINFKIYDVLTGGNSLWQENQNVLVEKGIFNVNLGSTEDLDLPFDKQYYLEIKVGTEIITPRQMITSSGYAMSAQNLEGSITGTQIQDGTVSNNDIGSGISATKIGSGNISNTEFGYLDGLTKNIQSQFNKNHCAVITWTGNGASSRNVTNSSMGFTPTAALVYRINTNLVGGYIENQSGQAIGKQLLGSYGASYTGGCEFIANGLRVHSTGTNNTTNQNGEPYAAIVFNAPRVSG